MASKSKKKTTTELISWGARVLPNGVIGAQSFATNQRNVYFLMEDGTVKPLIPEVSVDFYKAMPQDLNDIVQVAATGDYGFALGKSGDLYAWGGNEDLKNELVPEGLGKIKRIIVQDANDYHSNIFVVCILENGTTKSWMAFDDDEGLEIVERIEKIKNLADFQWANEHSLILDSKGALTLLEKKWDEEGLKEHKFSGIQCAHVSERRGPIFVDKSGEIYQGYPLPNVFPRKGIGNKRTKCSRIFHVLDYNSRARWTGDVTYLLDEKGQLSSKAKAAMLQCNDFWYKIPENLDNVIQVDQWGEIVIALRTIEAPPQQNPIESENYFEGDIVSIPTLNWLSKHKISNLKITHLTDVEPGFSDDCSRLAGIDSYGNPFVLSEFPSEEVFNHPELTSPFWLPSGCVKIKLGHDHNLMLTDSGQVIGWGNNSNKQCFTPDFNGLIIKDIAAGFRSSVVLTDDGDLIGWGDEIDPVDEKIFNKTKIKEHETSRKRWIKSLRKEKVKTLLSNHNWINQKGVLCSNKDSVIVNLLGPEWPSKEDFKSASKEKIPDEENLVEVVWGSNRDHVYLKYGNGTALFETKMPEKFPGAECFVKRDKFTEWRDSGDQVAVLYFGMIQAAPPGEEEYKNYRLLLGGNDAGNIVYEARMTGWWRRSRGLGFSKGEDLKKSYKWEQILKDCRINHFSPDNILLVKRMNNGCIILKKHLKGGFMEWAPLARDLSKNKKLISKGLQHFSSKDVKSFNELEKLVQGLFRGRVLLSQANDWVSPVAGNKGELAGTRGRQWRLVMAYAGFEMILKAILQNDKSLGPDDFKKLVVKIDPSRVKIKSPVSGSKRFQEWMGKNEKILDFLNVGRGDRSVLKSWILEKKTINDLPTAIALAKALRNATAHGALSAKKCEDLKLSDTIKELPRILFETSESVFMKLTKLKDI